MDRKDFVPIILFQLMKTDCQILLMWTHNPPLRFLKVTYKQNTQSKTLTLKWHGCGKNVQHLPKKPERICYILLDMKSNQTLSKLGFLENKM